MSKITNHYLTAFRVRSRSTLRELHFISGKRGAAPIPTFATANEYALLNEAVDAGIRELSLTGIHSSPLSGKSE